MSISNWFKRRAEKAKQAHYKRGYDYAAGELLRGEATPLEMMNRYGTSATFNEAPHLVSFDRGMEDATDKLCESGAIKDDRIHLNYYG